MTGFLFYLLASSWSKEQTVFNPSTAHSEINKYLPIINEIMSNHSKEDAIHSLAFKLQFKDMNRGYDLDELKFQHEMKFRKVNFCFACMETSYKDKLSCLSQRFVT